MADTVRDISSQLSLRRTLKVKIVERHEAVGCNECNRCVSWIAVEQFARRIADVLMYITQSRFSYHV